MRLHTVELKQVPPVARFEVSNLADIIVLAGPNGVGKTRLAQAILNAFRNPSPHPRLVVQATVDSEKTLWGKDQLDTSIAGDAQLLTKLLQRKRKRTRWQSIIVQFESDRGNPVYSPYGFTWDAADPWDELLNWDYAFNNLRSRYQDTIASLFRKVHNLNDAIARRGRELIAAGGGNINPADFPDPILPFKEAFGQLLAPKQLVDPDPRDQTLYYTYNDKRHPISSLSSGEREVVTIVFDFLLREPSDSIIVFDEPELHLHPELSYKLLHALRNSGRRNQFIFVTHSPDIITASLEHSVVFIGPAKTDGSNQAIVVREDDSTNEALRLIGQSIGIVSLGKRIVLIEGSQTSLDKQTYGAILKNRFPNLVLVPSGGRGLIQSFHVIAEEILRKTLWGVEFFMLCDRDALPVSKAATAIETKAGGRLRKLSRYHLENYFLDEGVLAALFSDWEPENSWLRDPTSVNAKLKEIATTMVPYATALTIAAKYREQFGNLDLMVKGCHGTSLADLSALILTKSSEESTRYAKLVSPADLKADIEGTYKLLTVSLEDGSWKSVIPGKSILEQFASIAGVQSGRLKIGYLAESERASVHPFQEVIDIFSEFASA